MVDPLRIKAEELLNKNPAETPTLSTADVQRLFHELNVHQIELQMQNEELRRAQHELSDARDAYMELYEFAPVGYLTLDRDTRILEANFTAATLLGVERAGLLGKTFASFVHHDALDSWDHHHRRICGGQGTRGGDFVLQRPDGTAFTAKVECVPRPDAGHCLLTMTDISERVLAEEALRKNKQELAALNRELEQRVEKRTAELKESEERFRTMFEEAPDAMVMIDLEGRFVDGNKAVESQTGYGREELVDRNVYEFGIFPPDARAIVTERIGRTRKGEKLEPVEYLLRRKDGTDIPVEVSSMLIHIEGKPVLLSSSRDLVERKRQDEELHRNQKELRKLASELSLAEQRERERIARELHDGVSQMLSSTYLRLGVLKENELPAGAVEALDTVYEIVEETLQQVRTLTFELSCPMLNELGLAAALEELCSSMSRPGSTQFEFIGAMEQIPMHLDRKVVLYRSVRELLINVMKHSGAQNATVELEEKDNQVSIRVTDDGKGFDATMAGKGFSPTGGFGLFNIREYLQHANGNLLIESIHGDGTRVVMTLPLEAEHG